MAVYLSPDVFPTETDFSTYVTSLATSVFGLVGVFERGPVSEPTTVTSFPKAQDQFGKYIPQGIGMYALKAYFDNGGGRAVVVRTASYSNIADRATLTAQKAEAVVQGAGAIDAFRIRALNEGAWGNNVSAIVSDVDTATKTFTLVIKDGSYERQYVGVTLDAFSKDFIEARVNKIDERVWITSLAVSALDPTAGTKALAGGQDGLTGLKDADFIGDAGSKTGLHAFTAVEDVNVIAIPGKTSPAVIAAGIAYAENRKDALFLGDTPEGLTVQQALDFRKGQGTYTHGAFNSSYGALYYPHVKIQDPVTGGERIMPPSAFVAGRIAYSDQVGGVWKAPAGLERGVLQNVIGVERVVDKGERDMLYPEGVNPIASFSEGGIVIWGQKTLQAKPSATDRINVRRLMMYVIKAATQTSKYLLFEQHTEALRNQFVRLLEPFLRDLKSNEAFYDFKVQCDDVLNTPSVIDSNQLKARVFVKPTKTAEFIPIDFAIAPTGAVFEEL